MLAGRALGCGFSSCISFLVISGLLLLFFCVHISISQSSLSTELLMSRPLNEMQNSNRLDYQSSEVPPKRRDGKFADYGIASTAPVECRCDAYAYYLGAELEVVLCREPIGMGSG